MSRYITWEETQGFCSFADRSYDNLEQWAKDLIVEEKCENFFKIYKIEPIAKIEPEFNEKGEVVGAKINKLTDSNDEGYHFI